VQAVSHARPETASLIEIGNITGSLYPTVNLFIGIRKVCSVLFHVNFYFDGRIPLHKLDQSQQIGLEANLEYLWTPIPKHFTQCSALPRIRVMMTSVEPMLRLSK